MIEHPVQSFARLRPAHVRAQSSLPDGARRFETFWSVDARVVRHAARICAQLGRQYGAETPMWPQLDETPPEASEATRRASGVLDRMLGYLSAELV